MRLNYETILPVRNGPAALPTCCARSLVPAGYCAVWRSGRQSKTLRGFRCAAATLRAVAGIALLTALALMPVGPAAAQTFTILKSFGILTNVTGFNPQSTLVQGADGTLYGTTSAGEANVMGTVFKVQPDGSGFAVLHNFTGPDGASPYAGLTLSGSTLYGTTYSGGSSNCGTVFKLNTDGTGFTLLLNFSGYSDGGFPQAGLTLSGSTLYGTASGAGPLPASPNGYGTVFKLNTDGTGYTVLKSFTSCPDGENPEAELTLSGSTLYGTTRGGGGHCEGTVFKVNTDGTGYTVLWNFSGRDGAYPQATLILSGGTLFGTTSTGVAGVDGTVFSLNTDGTGFTVLYSFTGSGDGAYPQAGLTLSGSTLYGTTRGFGPVGQNVNATVFSINTDGTAFTVLNYFSGQPDGANPLGLTLSGSTLYGTTYAGGSSDYGTLFSLNTDGTGYTVLKNFAYSDGRPPFSGLALFGNTLYGTTWYGGGADGGTVFKLNTDGTGYAVLKNFAVSHVTAPPDGFYPYGGLALSGNTLYGTTIYGGVSIGGSAGAGTVFSLNTDGTGFTVLYDFTGTPDGAVPEGRLTLSGGTLYGTTVYSGSVDNGTVFKLNTDGTGYIVLYDFSSPGDVGNPYAGVTLSGNRLYGMAGGAVFSLNTDGTGYTVLHNFGGPPDGANPSGDLTLSGSTLYGTTVRGGSSNFGTVFKLNTDGTGYTVLKSFTGSPDGANPSGDLTLSGSTLYGTTSSGGSAGGGTVFKLSTDGTGHTVLWNFSSSGGGVNPQAGVTLSGNTLFGTTAGGGELGEGVVFSLNLAPVLNITTIPGSLVLSWADPAFSLQSAPAVSGVYTNIPGAISPYTESLWTGQKFFRLISN